MRRFWGYGGLLLAGLWLCSCAGGDLGPCDIPRRDLPSSAEEFSALADELAGGAAREDGKGAGKSPLRLPEQPLVFDQVEVPSSLQGLAEDGGTLGLLRGTLWPWRGDNQPARSHVAVRQFLDAESNGEPLYVSQYVNDSKLRRFFQAVPHALRGARRLPIAVLARPSEGLRMHPLPDARWLLQLRGRSTWRLAKPDDVDRHPPLPACEPQVPELVAHTCELRPGSLLYVPAKWGWSACAQGGAGGAGEPALAVGAGGSSKEWPDLFHLIAEGKVKEVDAQLQQDASQVHVGDRLTSHTPMDLAVQIGDLRMAKLLQQYGGRPNDTASATLLHPLHYASVYQHHDVMQWLLEQGADPSCRAADGYNPIHYAAEAGNLPILNTLIEARANLHAATTAKVSPAHLAVGAGHLAVLRRLRDAGAELSAVDGHGCDPTIWAAKRGDVPMLGFLIDDEGLSKDARCDSRETAAHYAVQYGHMAVLEALKARGADFTAKNDRKHTPLHVAVEAGLLHVIDWFAEAKLKRISPKTPGLLHLAAWRGRIDSLEALLRHGADVHALDPHTKSPAVEFASTRQVYELLSKHSAKLPEGWVHRAAGRGQLDLLKKLVPGQRELELALSQPHDGVYPAHLAAQSAHREVLKWICSQMGANCSARSLEKTYGRTAVHFACVGGEKDDAGRGRTRLDIVKYLVREVKIMPGDEDDLGITAVELAGVTGHLSIVKYLLLEQRADLEGLFHAKRAGALNATVDKWVMDYVPKGMYENWLRIGKPPHQPKKAAAKRRRRRRSKEKKEL